MSSDDWSSKVESAVATVVGKIPTIGIGVKVLVELFWPSSGEDIWSQIKDEVAALIDEKILVAELDERQETLDGLNTSLQQYCSALDTEKGSLMSAMLVSINSLYSELTESDNALHLVPITVSLAHLHLTLLRERYSHGEEMYGEDNTAVWESELNDQYDNYKAFFSSIYPAWQTWRYSQITTNWDTSLVVSIIPHDKAYGKVSDSVTGESFEYEDDMNSNDDYYKPVMQASQTRMQNDANALMINALASTAILNQYLPGQEEAAPVVDDNVATFWMGPYSCATLGSQDDGDYATNVDDTSGTITQFYIREWNSIDGVQFKYDGHDGNFIGDSSGGEAHTIDVPAGAYATGLNMRFAKGLMCSIETAFSDGSTSGELGNRTNWGGNDVAALPNNSYQLICGKFKKGSGPSSTQGTSVIELQFRHEAIEVASEEMAAKLQAALKSL